MAEVVLEVPAKPEYLSLVRQVVAATAAVESFGDDRIDDIRIVVSEATTNAIESHSVFARDERVMIRCDLGGDRIEVEVSDRGGGFDPARETDIPEPEGPQRLQQERGLGLPLMRHLTDESEITSADGGTSVRLVVYTPWSERGG